MVAADDSTITWGAATNGELGYGPGKKSSANPDKCLALEGIRMHSVTAGSGFSVFLAPAGHAKIETMPVFESQAPEVEAGADEQEPAAAGGKGGKGKGAAAAGAKRKAAEPAGKGAKKK